jgi:hypothetical protein
METGQTGFPSQSALNRFVALDTKPLTVPAQIQFQASTDPLAKATQQC